MTDTLDVLAICGSLRKDSYNAALQRALPELAPPDLNIVPAPSFRNFPLLDMDIVTGSGIPADVAALGAAIRQADGVIITSPEYNYSMPGILKNAIDWLSRLSEQPFAGKPVLLQSAATGIFGGVRAQYHLRQTMVFLDAFVMSKPEVFVGQAASRFDEKTLALVDGPTRELVTKQLWAFAGYIRHVRPGK
ncbi:MAG: hypothetical protein RLZ98_2449 [Pseudomonadota bacterium]|jgi:chromate reductase